MKREVAKISKKDVEKGKTKAALSYLWAVGLIMLLTEKKNAFVKFHAKQGTALFILSLIPVIQIITPFIMLYGLIMAATGKSTKIPLVNEAGEWIANLLKME